MVGATFISSFCDFNKELLEQNEYQSYLSDFGIEME